MQWINNIKRSKSLEGKRILITGAGFKEYKHKFTDIITDEDSGNDIYAYNTKEKKLQRLKVNIGTAIAFVLAANGATVHLVSRTQEKLKVIKERIKDSLCLPEEKIEYSALDLLDPEQVKTLIRTIPKDKPLYWVQSVGLGAGSYKVKDDNPYLELEDIDPELLRAELKVAEANHIMIQALLPRFLEQEETRVAMISSMSAIRHYTMGGAHCTAKAAISAQSEVLRLRGYKNRIYVTEILPGGIDTGMYDNPSVQRSIIEFSNQFGGTWNKKITLAPPVSVGEAIAFAFTAPAHIPTITLVAKGQVPHDGS